MPPVLVALLALLVAGILSANVLASLAIARDRMSTAAQKVAQFALVWFLPVIGAIAVLLMTRQSLEPGSGRYPACPGKPEDPDVAHLDYGSDSSSH